MASNIQVGIGSVNKEMDKGAVGIGEVWKEIDKISTGIGGVWKEAWSGYEPYLYVLDKDRYLYKINKDGEQIWKSTWTYFGNITVIPDGHVYTQDYDKLYKINPDGGHVWSISNRGAEIRAVNDNNIYALWDYKVINCYKPDGTERYEKAASVDSLPLHGIDADGTYAYFISSQSIYKISAVSGGTITELFSTGKWLRGMAMDSQKNIYSAGENSDLWKYKLDGTLEWRYYTESNMIYTLVADKEGSVYISINAAYTVRKINSSGDLVWQYYSGITNIADSIDVDKNGNVYCCMQNDRVLFLSSNGGYVRYYGVAQPRSLAVTPGNVGAFSSQW